MFQKKSNKLIAYVGPFPFPHGAPSSRRVMGIADALRVGNNEVIIGAGQQNDINTHPSEQACDYSISYLNGVKHSNASRLRKGIHMLSWGGNAVRWLNALKTQPDAVIDYSGYSLYDVRLIPWCREKKVPLIIDAVEWYEPSHVLLGPWGPFRWDAELAMRFFHVRAGNIIAISSYLEKYYLNKGCRTIRIPPTLNTQKMAYRVESNQPTTPLTLAYAGTPGKKDLLNNVAALPSAATPTAMSMTILK